MLNLKIDINEAYIEKMIDYCNDFIQFHRLKFSLEQFLFNFDRITPQIDEKQILFKVYGNFRELTDEQIAQKLEAKKLKSADSIKKTKKQLFYFGKKDKEKANENERILIYSNVIQFYSYLRQLKTLIELEQEMKKEENIGYFVDELIKKGF